MERKEKERGREKKLYEKVAVFIHVDQSRFT